MKKNNILVLPLLLALLIGMSGLKVQAQSFQWGVIGGALNSMQTSGSWFRVKNIAVYKDQRIYSHAMVGSWNLEVAGQQLPSFSDLTLTESVVSAFDDKGSHLWSKVIGSDDGSDIQDIFTDSLGNVYATGSIRNYKQHFHTDTSFRYFTVASHPEVFMIKYDSAGTLQWIRQIEPDTVVENSHVVRALLSPDQTIHWLCYMRKDHLGQHGDTVTQEGLYVLRFNTQGQYLSKTAFNVELGFPGRFTDDRDTKFRYDPTRGRYYIGGINDNINPLVVGQDTVRGFMYLAAFDTTGQVVWKKETTPKKQGVVPNDPNLNDFILDSFGNIYLTGTTFDKQILFNGVKIRSPVGFSSPIPYIASLAPNGNHRWLNIGSGNFLSQSFQITLNQGELAIAGGHTGLFWNHPTDQDTLLQKNGERSFIARFDTATGDLRGMAEIKDNSSGSNRAWSIASDSRGRYYLGGYFSSKIYLGNQWFTKLGSQRSFYVTQYACDSLQGSLSTAYDSTRGWKLTYRGTPADSVVWQLGDGSPTRQGDSIFHIYQNLGQYPICATVYNNYCGNFSLCDTLNVNRISTTAYPTALPLEVYPNPAQDHLRVWYPGEEPVAYRLLSPAGATVQQGRLQPGAQNISLNTLPPGLYLLQVHSKPVRSVKVVIGKR